MSETTMGDLAAAIFTRPAWWAEAACAGIDTTRFYPERGEGVNNVKRLCFFCPVKQDCLDDALSRYDKIGVWGGRSERERRRMRRAIRAAECRGEVYVPLAIDYLPPRDPPRWPKPVSAVTYTAAGLARPPRTKKLASPAAPRRVVSARFDGKQLVGAA